MRLFLVVLAAACVVMPITGAAVGQNGNASGSDDVVPDVEECDRPIGELVRICSAELVDGQAEVVLETRLSRPADVTVTDAGAIWTGDDVDREDVRVPADGRVRVSVRAVRSDRGRAVTVDTGEAIDGVVLSDGSALIGGPWSHRDAQAAAVGSALVVGTLAGVAVLRRRRGHEQTAERIA